MPSGMTAGFAAKQQASSLFDPIDSFVHACVRQLLLMLVL